MTPCTIVIVPSVTMNGSLSKKTTKKTLTRPTTMAAPIPARQARRTGHPCCTLSTARVIADRPSEEPSDRSTLAGQVPDRHVLACHGRVAHGLHRRQRQRDRLLVFDRGRFRWSALIDASRRPDYQIDQLLLANVGRD